MKVCAISDTHGQHRSLEIKEADVLCIAGDISPLSIQGRNSEMLAWLKQDFIPWCEELPVRKVILVAGNHDFYPYHHEEAFRNLIEDSKIIYLKDELYEFEGVKFWGTPWCTIFGNWAFMKLPEFELQQFMKMPDDVDILIAHNPPYGACDVCLQHPWGNTSHLGNRELRRTILVKHPKKVFCGHLHTGKFHEMIENTDVYNVSVINEQYEIFRGVTYLTL